MYDDVVFLILSFFHRTGAESSFAIIFFHLSFGWTVVGLSISHGALRWPGGYLVRGPVFAFADDQHFAVSGEAACVLVVDGAGGAEGVELGTGVVRALHIFCDGFLVHDVLGHSGVHGVFVFGRCFVVVVSPERHLVLEDIAEVVICLCLCFGAFF